MAEERNVQDKQVRNLAKIQKSIMSLDATSPSERRLILTKAIYLNNKIPITIVVV